MQNITCNMLKAALARPVVVGWSGTVARNKSRWFLKRGKSREFSFWRWIGSMLKRRTPWTPSDLSLASFTMQGSFMRILLGTASLPLLSLQTQSNEYPSMANLPDTTHLSFITFDYFMWHEIKFLIFGWECCSHCLQKITVIVCRHCSAVQVWIIQSLYWATQHILTLYILCTILLWVACKTVDNCICTNRQKIKVLFRLFHFNHTKH